MRGAYRVGSYEISLIAGRRHLSACSQTAPAGAGSINEKPY